MASRGPQPNRPRARVYVIEGDAGEPELFGEFDGVDPEVLHQFREAATEMGRDPGWLLEQQMSSFLHRRGSQRNDLD